MSDITVQSDYTNLQFHVWKDGKLVEVKLPAEVQAAIIMQVAQDLCDYFRQVLESGSHDAPPELAGLTRH